VSVIDEEVKFPAPACPLHLAILFFFCESRPSRHLSLSLLLLFSYGAYDVSPRY